MNRPFYKENKTEKTSTYISSFLNDLLYVQDNDYTIENNKKIENYDLYTVSFKEIDSTHLLALKIDASEIHKHSIISISSDRQTNGIGQRQNKFQSPNGNLYITYIIKERDDVNFNLLPIVISNSVLEAIKEYVSFKNVCSDLDLYCKWPNDIMVKDKKISGILCNTSIIPSNSKDISMSMSYINPHKVIISVGINLNITPKVDGCETVCLKEALNMKDDVDIIEFKDILSKVIFRKYSKLSDIVNEFDYESIIEEYMSSLKYKNEYVEIYDSYANASKVIGEGRFLGVNQNGFAVIEYENDDGYKEFSIGRMRKGGKDENMRLNYDFKEYNYKLKDDEEKDFDSVNTDNCLFCRFSYYFMASTVLFGFILICKYKI